MKKAIVFIICIFMLVLSGCKSANIAIIGGADGPTAILVTNNNDYKKESVRMVKINGALYYETDKENSNLKCGVMDGEFEKSAGEYEIPQGDNQSNFDDADAYQTGNENTIEILIGDDWKVFNKVDTNSDVLKYKYCYKLVGKLSDTSEDAEFLVLANEENITFDQANYQLVGSDTAKMKDIYVLPIL